MKCGPRKGTGVSQGKKTRSPEQRASRQNDIILRWKWRGNVLGAGNRRWPVTLDHSKGNERKTGWHQSHRHRPQNGANIKGCGKLRLIIVLSWKKERQLYGFLRCRWHQNLHLYLFCLPNLSQKCYRRLLSSSNSSTKRNSCKSSSFCVSTACNNVRRNESLHLQVACTSGLLKSGI